ncbi:DASH complex, subunit Spc34 [Viridothelium virens]|uniref:DASH complex subunit SPC34 n=1 Tax=Viridothelium virens TaxID=1048519 RepID=A0A6A6H7Y3_VIRVR|nr:DASH complex, subunit Spc34 [Viridothelium virens]
MSLLNAHLEQISLCAASIAELPFPQPKIFTNALLHPHDITALIRDTEVHERALFTMPPPAPTPKAQDPSGRRQTAFGGSQTPSASRAPRRNTAVAAVLGGDMVERLRRGGGGGVGTGLGPRPADSRNKGEVDVELLLEGAEKLCGVYPISGATEKIATLRRRHQQLASSIEYYEEEVAQQTAQLNRMNRPAEFEDDGFDEDAGGGEEGIEHTTAFTVEDMQREEEEIKELERKKQGLEDRVSGMEKDLGGLMR